METTTVGSLAGATLSPTRDKRRKIVLLRGLLIIAVGGLLVDSGVGMSPAAAVALLLVFAASDVLLALAPLSLVGSLTFELLVGAADLALVSLGIEMSGAATGILPVSCLLMALVVALGNHKAHAIAGAVAVGAFHTWLVLTPASGFGATRQLALQILFLCSVAIYYGYLVRGIHHRRRKAEADLMERKELSTLLEILDTVTSSLDLRHVSRTIVEKITEVVPALRCSLLFIDGAGERCFVMASHDSPDVDMLELDLQKYPEIRRAIDTRQPVLIQDVAHDPLMAAVREVLAKLDFQSILVVPLTFGGEVLGSLCLKSALAKQEFGHRDVNFCIAVARASANALKNALLHRQVREESGRHRRTGEKLVRILDQSPDLILTTDNEGRITEFNRGAERLLGRGRDDVMGQPYEGIFGDHAGLVERIRAEGSLSNYSCELAKKEGAQLSLELNMSILKDEAGQVAGTVWVGRDVSELKSTQLQLLQAKKLSTIGEIISGVAHELNNPLSAVLGFSQLLVGRHPQGPVSRDLEKIYESALRCQKIVKNLLSFARVHKPERRYLGINGILEKTLDLRKYQLRVNNVEVVRELGPELPRTMLDFHQMQQVFLNLVNNAQQAMAIVRDRPGRLMVRTTSAGGWIRVELSDNGEGMDQETLERIFDPFFTTKGPGEGTGLGLSVSYGIVAEHGGRIYARSHKGEGTTLVVELPVREEERQEHRPDVVAGRPVGEPVEGPGGRILVVDDEPLILDLLMEVLEGGGYHVDTAANGEEACKKIRSPNYDLVITDVRMPEMNGMDLYGKILSLRPELERRVIFMTGDLIDKDTVRFLGEINARILPKPLELPLVIEVVRKALAPACWDPPAASS